MWMLVLVASIAAALNTLPMSQEDATAEPKVWAPHLSEERFDSCDKLTKNTTSNQHTAL